MQQPPQNHHLKTRLLYLDGLRGFAALMVVLFHFWGGAGSPVWLIRLTTTVTVDLLSPIGALGGSRISLFFVLSGFLLYLPFARRDMIAASGQSQSSGRETQEPLLSWFWRRLRRIALPYYVAIVLAIAIVLAAFYLDQLRRVWIHHLPLQTPQFDTLFISFPEGLFFMHGMVPGSEQPSFNPPLWTLTPEIQLYLAFPLLVAMARWRGVCVGGKWHISGLGMAVALTVGTSVGYRVWLYEQIGYAVRLHDDVNITSEYHCLVNTFLGRWAEFALGMGAAGLVVRDRVRSPLLLLPAFCVCLVWFLVLRSDLAIGGWIGRIFLAMEPAPSPLADEVGGAAFALLILCCAAISRFALLFSWRPLVALGTIAYSLYLIHVPVLYGFQWTMKMLLRRELVTTSTGSLSVLAMNIFVGLPLALFLAHLFWRLCERPFLSRERQITLNNSPAASQGM